MKIALEPKPNGAPVDARSSSRGLVSGNYLVELATSGPLAPPALEEGLELLGWSDGKSGPPIVDLNPRDDETSERVHRFVGTWSSDRRLELVDTPLVRWTRVAKLPFDPFADVTRESRPFRLEPDRAYALRFLTRMKAEPTRGGVEEIMKGMGLFPSSLACVKRNTHLRGQPNISCAVWCAVARWTGPRMVHTIEDPIGLEDAVLLEEEI